MKKFYWVRFIIFFHLKYTLSGISLIHQVVTFDSSVFEVEDSFLDVIFSLEKVFEVLWTYTTFKLERRFQLANSVLKCVSV